jgi:hypothetical protein
MPSIQEFFSPLSYLVYSKTESSAVTSSLLSRWKIYSYFITVKSGRSISNALRVFSTTCHYQPPEHNPTAATSTWLLHGMFLFWWQLGGVWAVDLWPPVIQWDKLGAGTGPSIFTHGRALKNCSECYTIGVQVTTWFIPPHQFTDMCTPTT